MLNKLIKYEFKEIYKKLLFSFCMICSVAVVCRIITMLSWEVFGDGNIMWAMTILGLSIYALACVIFFGYLCYILVQRFLSTINGNKNVLTYSLPVEFWKIMLAKIFSASICLYLYVLGVAVSFYVLSLFSNYLWAMMPFLLAYMNPFIFVFLFISILSLIVSAFFALYKNTGTYKTFILFFLLRIFPIIPTLLISILSSLFINQSLSKIILIETIVELLTSVIYFIMLIKNKKTMNF